MNALSPSNEDSHRAPTPQCDRYAENERGSCLHNAGGYRQPPCRCPYPRAPNTFSGRVPTAIVKMPFPPRRQPSLYGDLHKITYSQSWFLTQKAKAQWSGLHSWSPATQTVSVACNAVQLAQPIATSRTPRSSGARSPVRLRTLRGEGWASSGQLWWAWLVSSWLLYGAALKGEAGHGAL